MGAWGYKNFENDQAWAFTDDFIQTPSETHLRDALTTILNLADESAYIEVDDASAALVAAEIIAATMDKPSADFPDELQEAMSRFLIENEVSRFLIENEAETQKTARWAVRQVLNDSELQGLWAENGEPNEWQRVQQDLLERLQ